MKQERNQLGPYNWSSLFYNEEYDFTPRVKGSYDFLEDYSKVYNQYSASVSQPNPFSNKVVFIMDALSKMDIKFRIDIFPYNGGKLDLASSYDANSHKLINIIAEPNPNATGPATVFLAHHDVANVRSDNCQDNGASVCNLLQLASLVKAAGTNSTRTIILFSDCEEYGAKGAAQFARNSKLNKENPFIVDHEIYGQISAVVNLELTGTGSVVWSDCETHKRERDLHTRLEDTLGRPILKLKTPPNDAIAFRKYNYPVLCIGTLPEDDVKETRTWRLCHSLEDTIGKCDRKSMEDFTTFLFNLTKTTTTEHGLNPGANETGGTLQS